MASKSLEGLSAQAQGFLIATLLFRSADQNRLFAQLPEDTASLLSERARHLLQMDKVKRVQLLVTELKRFILMSEQPWILAVHPSWVQQLAAQEEEPVRSLVLAALSPNLTKRQYPDALLAQVRRIAERHLVPMRQIPFDPCLTPEQLLVLTRDELDRVVARVGVEAVAKFIKSEALTVQREIAQRLEFNMGKKLLQCCDGEVQSDIDVFACITTMAVQGQIDERFSQCIRSQ